MGFWKHTVLGLPLPKEALPTNLVSTYGADHSLEQAVALDFFGAKPALTDMSEELALRVSGVKRALEAHTALVAPLRFEVYQDGVVLEDQPSWVHNSESGIPPYLRMVGTVRDLFFHGESLWGGTLDAFGKPVDFIRIPQEFYTREKATGVYTVSDQIPARYRQRLVPIQLGSGGLLLDGIDTLRQARILELARQARLASPAASTELHITAPEKDEMTAKEREALAKSYEANRSKYSVAVTPSYLEVKERGTQAIDLFESGINSLRLDLANHCAVPASFIEGVSGSGSGDMSYTNKQDSNGELYVFGSSRFTKAIEARLSMDDVAGPGAEVRADLTPLISVPMPAIADPTED